MAEDDYALVVGISCYPGLSDLQGPGADAIAFANWLKTPEGGQVPAPHIDLLLSPQPPPQAATQAEPIVSQVEEILEKHINRAEESGGHAGRRLYLYFAGHGFSPDVQEVAVLMANAARRRTGYHIPGRRYAQWFQTAGFFDEVVLFMDCCREPKLNAPPHNPPWDNSLSQKPSEFFYGFATCWSRSAREQATNGGPVRGLFTAGLLEALSGAVQPNSHGQVTASMVEGFVTSYLRSRSATTEPQVPEFDYATPDHFVVMMGPPPKTSTVHVTRADLGNPAEVVVTDGSGANIPGNVAGGMATFDLAAGLYKVAIPNKPPVLFEVLSPKGSLDVLIPA